MRTLVIILTIGFLSFAGNAQIDFYRVFSDNGADVGQGIVQLPDSSYVVTGYSSSFQQGPSQAILLKVDSLGNYLWSYHYGGAEIDAGRRVLYQENFGFFICGYTNSMGNGGYDYYLVKTDENGTLEWERSYGGSGWEQVHDAALTRDTGTLMVGESSSNNTDNKDCYIVRTDKQGDTLWTKTYGDSGHDAITCIRQFNDSMFVVGGYKYIEDLSETKGYFAYIKDDGTFMWEDTLGGDGDYWINDFTFQTGKILGVGGTSGPTKDGKDLLFYLADMGGNQWGLTEVPNAGDHEYTLVTTYTPAGDFYAVNTSIDDFTYEGGEDLLISSHFSNFAYNNGFGIAHTDPDIGGQIIPTSDGAAVIVGYTTGMVSGGNELFIAKIGPSDTYPDALVDAQIDNIVTLDEELLNSDVTVYPNPASDLLFVATDLTEYNEVRLVNSMGQEVKSIDLHLQASMQIDDLPSGWYVMVVSGKNVPTVHKRLIVQH